MASVVAIGLGALLAVLVVGKTASYLTFRYRCYQDGCQPPPRYPHKDPIFGLDLFLAHREASKNGKILATEQDLFARYGKTYECNSWGSRLVQTMQPENIHAVLVGSFDKFGVQAKRLRVAKPFLGPGVFTTDGPYWQHSRELIKPMFARAQITDLDVLQIHVDRFMSKLPLDGSTVELQSLLKLMEKPNEESSELLKTLTAALRRLGLRLALGRLVTLFPWDRTFAKLASKVHAVVDKSIDDALSLKGERMTNSVDFKGNIKDTGRKRYIIVDQLIKSNTPKDEIRNQLLNIFLPARDAACIALSGVLFHLARHPDVWNKLRAEVLTLENKEVNYNNLQSLTYMKAVLNESLRLTSPANPIRRYALSSTTLPTGGGPNGTSPIYIRAGDLVTINFPAMQRDPSIWGPDAEDFRPERWASGQPSSAIYLPYSAGPRICPGKQMTQTENAYTLVRLMRKFEGLENRDLCWEYVEESRLTKESRNGVLVGLIPSGGVVEGGS
ncbi:MAG: hypothetical protein Q9160_001109 [Pyrenula sp. 1 TL-2023]